MTRVFWNIWSSYATFYFGRVNLSIVVPVLLATYGDLSLYNVGLVSSGFMATYAIGQFLHGQISERFNPFIYIGIGRLGSAIGNLTLGFSAGFFWALLVGEMIDGGFQSMGWSSTVRANAETSKDPEKYSTVLGTAYQVGNSVAWIVCAFAVGHFGWQAGFWVATVVMMVRAVTLLASRYHLEVKPRKIGKQVRLTLSWPIFISGLSLCLLNMVRYGVIIWIPTYLYREFTMPIEEVGLNIFLIPIAGVVGTLMYTRFKAPKDVLSVLYLLGLGSMFLLLPGLSGMAMFAVLLLSGFFLYGPHVFLVTTFPTRFHEHKLVAAAAGFIDGWGYIGAIAIGVLVPFLLDQTGSWTSVFYFWDAVSFVIVALVMFVYIRTRKKGLFGSEKAG